MRFTKHMETAAEDDQWPGGFLHIFRSANDEGYTIRYTNLHIGKDKIGTGIITVGDSYTIAHYGDTVIIEGVLDINEVKGACRKHYASLSDQNKIDFRVSKRSEEIASLRSLILDFESMMEMDSPLAVKYRDSDLESINYMKTDLKQLLKERAEDPDDHG